MFGKRDITKQIWELLCPCIHIHIGLFTPDLALNYLQLEELKLVPADSEKEITDMEAKKKELEEKVKIEEEKMSEIMASLKTETQDLQKEKDVSRDSNFLFYSSFVLNSN